MVHKADLNIHKKYNYSKKTLFFKISRHKLTTLIKTNLNKKNLTAYT